MYILCEYADPRPHLGTGSQTYTSLTGDETSGENTSQSGHTVRSRLSSQAAPGTEELAGKSKSDPQSPRRPGHGSRSRDLCQDGKRQEFTPGKANARPEAGEHGEVMGSSMDRKWIGEGQTAILPESGKTRTQLRGLRAGSCVSLSGCGRGCAVSAGPGSRVEARDAG